MPPQSHGHSDVFQAIADPTRRALLARLAAGREVPVAELSRDLPLPMTLSAVSQHLRVLRDAGLVSVRRAGRERYYRLNADPLREVAEWTRAYERFWPERLDRLGAYLEGKKETTER